MKGELMTRYLLFQGLTYYPYGGWGDFKGFYNSQEEASQEGKALCQRPGLGGSGYNWYHIAKLDLEVDAIRVVQGDLR